MLATPQENGYDTEQANLVAQSNLSVASTPLGAFAASPGTAIHQDESVIMITSPYTNGLTVPAIINPNATHSACQIMAIPAPPGSVVNGVGQGEVNCSSMTSPPITPPQVGSTSASPYPTQLTAQSSIVMAQQNFKDGSIPSSSKLVLSNAQAAAASGSQIQSNNYVHIPSAATMLYPTPPTGLPSASPISKPSFAINQHPNTQSQTLHTPPYPTKNYTATSPTLMSPPVTPYLDSQIMYIPTAAATLSDPSAQTYNQMFPSMYGSSGQSPIPTIPPQSIHPVVSGVTSGLECTSGEHFYPNQFPVSNNPGDIQYLNLKNGGGYLPSGSTTPSPYGYPQPANLISPSPMHVTSDRSVYSSTLSEVSYK